MSLEPKQERKLGSRLEVIKWWKQNAFGSDDNIEANLPHRLKVIFVKEGKRRISFCQRCRVSWPCLAAQEAAIERGRRGKSNN